MSKTLVIGFGNVYRQDDGVAFVALNALRQQLGRPIFDFDDDGFDDLGHEVDTVLLHQLVPELTDLTAGYDLIVFVDAHMGSIAEPIHKEDLVACRKNATVSHQLHPCTLLALTHELHGCQPRGVLLSILGHDFDFGEGLSEKTAALVPQAVAHILALAGHGPTERAATGI